MQEKIYCGNAKKIQTQFGEMYKGSMHKDDINKVVTWMKENGSDWFNFVILEKRVKVEGKPTHYLQLDDWKPQEREQEAVNHGDDLPF